MKINNWVLMKHWTKGYAIYLLKLQGEWFCECGIVIRDLNFIANRKKT